MTLTHFDKRGHARMVDVSGKGDTSRVAVASARVTMKPETLQLVLDRNVAKGDVLETARLAGIMAAKKTPDLIPLCHPIQIHSVKLDLEPGEDGSTILIRSEVGAHGKTGVEMDALTAAAVAGLTIYDMLKSVDRDIVVSDIMLIEKSGGKSGHYLREKKDPGKG